MAYLKFPLFLGRYVQPLARQRHCPDARAFHTGDAARGYQPVAEKGFSVHENPCKTEFVRARRDAPPRCPRMRAGARAAALETARRPRRLPCTGPSTTSALTSPADGTRPRISAPGRIPSFGRTRTAPAPFLFTTCGGAAVWLNGEKVLEFTPFTRNIPADTPLELTLRKGRNSVLVFL